MRVGLMLILFSTRVMPACVPISDTGTGGQGPLEVRVYQQGQLPAKTLKFAVEQAHRVLAAADVETVWECEGDGSADIQTTDQTPAKAWQRKGDRRGYLVVLIEDQVRKGAYPGSLGIAMPFGQTGIHVRIFNDRIERFAKDQTADHGTLLGHAMAHEIGHVLLESLRHSRSGIMKARWSAVELRSASTGSLVFSRAQARIMRENALRRALP